MAISEGQVSPHHPRRKVPSDSDAPCLEPPAADRASVPPRWNLNDWILALHLLSAFALVGAEVVFGR